MNFAGSVTGNGQRQVVFLDAIAVIPHPDQFDAALFHFHIQAPGTGIQAVFQQFFYDRGGTFHHFTSGDLVGEPG